MKIRVPPTWKVRESQGKSGNLGDQGKSGKSQGILDGVGEKEEKKKKHEINKRTRNNQCNFVTNFTAFNVLLFKKKNFKKFKIKKK